MEKASFSVMFYLKTKVVKPDGSSPIYMRITVNKSRAVVSIYRSVKQDDWDQKRFCSTKRTQNAEDLNDYIQQCQSRVYQYQKELEHEDIEVTALNLKKRYQGLDGKNMGIGEVFEKYNEKVQQRIGIDVVAATYQKYSVCLKHLRTFIQKKYKRKDLMLKEVNHEFVRGFEHHLRTIDKLSHNSSVKTLRTFRTIIKEALNNEWMTKDPFANIKLSLKPVERDRLTEEELARLAGKVISNSRLSTVRDIFLFSCYTGLAYSDLKELTWDHLEKTLSGRWRIVKKRKKTQRQLRIPVLPQALHIIEKYKDNPYCIEKNLVLPVKSNQKMNNYLKELADICDINKHISTHTGRHTFATTVALSNDMSFEVVSSILGHSSLEMTKVYAKMVDKRVDKEMDLLAQKLNFMDSVSSN